MAKIHSVLTSKGTSAFIGLNLIDITLTLLTLSWGGKELNPIYSYLPSTQLIPMAKVMLVLLVLSGLAIYNKLHLLRWLNIGLGLVVAWNFTAVTVQFL